MLSRKTSIDRVLAGTILLAIMLCLSIVLYSTYVSAALEFNWSIKARELEKERQASGLDSTPRFTVIYRDIYTHGWMSLVTAMLWATWILRKQNCSLLAVIIYVGVFLNLAVFWLLFTFMALYLENQSFHI